MVWILLLVPDVLQQVRPSLIRNSCIDQATDLCSWPTVYMRERTTLLFGHNKLNLCYPLGREGCVAVSPVTLVSPVQTLPAASMCPVSLLESTVSIVFSESIVPAVSCSLSCEDTWTHTPQLAHCTRSTSLSESFWLSSSSQKQIPQV